MSSLVKRHRRYINTNTNTDTPSTSDSTSISNTSSFELSENYNKSVRHLFLVRHGQYQRQRTESDGHLTDKGEKQAWYAANFLISQLPDDVLFDSLTHSDMIRTRETATIIYKQLKLMKKIDIEYFSIDTDFREHNLLFGFLLEGNWHALKRDYFHVKKETIKNARTTFEIIVAHRNIIGHCIELLTMIQPDKSIAFNASITHIIVDETDTIVDYAFKHNFIPVDLLTMWEIYLPIEQFQNHEHKYIHFDVNGVKGSERKGCCIRLFISCLR
ncbi:unnamed protein product [Adineta steineri]|uniref:Serine/threonine-protein phosphatase PGAM5, mitochondrial n=1 Tax=Adineta steineri TaxID=433720 RepID=A0A813MSQ1_9BILA|nr:unnamed protein product [Adineta steineri]